MTKQLLLSSTALVGAIALATPALADIEVTLSGQFEFGASFADKETIDNGRGYFFFMDSETVIRAEGASDSGINYAGKVELETDADIQNVNADETAIYFWGGFGRAELGRDDGAADNMFLAGEDFQAGTGGIDGDGANLDLPSVNDSGDAAKITYFTPRIAGFQAGVSYLPDTGDEQNDSDNDPGDFEDFFEVGANYTGAFGGADVTLTAVGAFGSEEDDGNPANDVGDRRDYGFGGGVEFGGFGVGAGYVVQDEAGSGEGFTVGAKYGFGPANVSVGYSRDNPDNADDVNVVAVSGDYGLFPGVTLKGDISFNDNDSDTADPITGNRDSTTAFVTTLQLDY
ncbi:MAG: porin [Geminicoccaceae bacterium]